MIHKIMLETHYRPIGEGDYNSEHNGLIDYLSKREDTSLVDRGINEITNYSAGYCFI